MIATNIGTSCVIVSTSRVTIQPALRKPEKALLACLANQQSYLSLFKLAAAAGLTYASAYGALYSLEGRGMVHICRNSHCLEVRPLASLLEDDYDA